MCPRRRRPFPSSSLPSYVCVFVFRFVILPSLEELNTRLCCYSNIGKRFLAFFPENSFARPISPRPENSVNTFKCKSVNEIEFSNFCRSCSMHRNIVGTCPLRSRPVFRHSSGNEPAKKLSFILWMCLTSAVRSEVSCCARARRAHIDSANHEWAGVNIRIGWVSVSSGIVYLWNWSAVTP